MRGPDRTLLLAAPASAADGIAVSAARLEGVLVLDGAPDERCWDNAVPFSEFVQQVPKPGAPATDRTEVRVLFDDDAIYFGVRAFQSGAPIVANELRRDAGRLHVRNDTFTVALDTFGDRRNGYIFIFNPLGAIADWAAWDEGRVFLQEWDTVREVQTTIQTWGWSAEMRLPFRSLRFNDTGEQRWGAMFRRIVLARNEWSYAIRRCRRSGARWASPNSRRPPGCRASPSAGAP